VNVPHKIIKKFGNDYVEAGSSSHKELRLYCPMCSVRKGTPDRKRKLYVNPVTLNFICFRCGYSGNVNRDYKSDSYDYEEDMNYEASSLIKDIQSVINSGDYAEDLVIPIEPVEEGRYAKEYLTNRGFTVDQMRYYDMRLGNSRKEFGRIIIPNKVDKLVYTDFYSARTFIDEIPKYHNPSVRKKSEIVFNLHRISDGDTVILVEGALTAVAAGHNAVASLGKTLSVSQASQIASKHPKKIYVNYDYGTLSESNNACSLLQSMLPDTEIIQVIMSTDKDAADLSRDEYAEILNNSRAYNSVIKEMEELISS
jgi:DNA primase